MSNGTTLPRRRTRLVDVANQAGVSIATASQALSGKPGQYRISADVTQRVQDTAKELGYAPNRLVRSMQGRQTHILSFFNGYRTRTPQDAYMNTLSTALERAAGSRGYDLLIHCDFSRSPQEIHEHLNGGIADAVLFFAPRAHDPLLTLLKDSRLPTLLIGGQVDGVLPQVTSDVEGGMRLVAERLVAFGHRNIRVLHDEGNTPEFYRRVSLLRQELGKYGVDLPAHCICQQDEMHALVNAAEPVTALFCPRDSLAYHFLDYCAEQGISVPQQLSVIGYDGLPWETRTGHTVASVRVNIEGMAEAAVERTIALLRGEALSTLYFLPTDFLEGTTLGQAPTP
ncbi:MAG: LacI family DNA-binding transcriptional regulator [Armatimonas sp.]